MKMQAIEKVQDGLEAAMSTLREIEGKSNGVSGSFADTMRTVGAGLDAIRWERQERTNRLRSLILKAYELILDGAGSDTLDTAEKASGVDWRETWREISRADPLGRLETSREYDDLETDLEALTAAIEAALDEEAAEAGPPVGDPTDPIDAIAAAALAAERTLRVLAEVLDVRNVYGDRTQGEGGTLKREVGAILERIEAYRGEDLGEAYEARGVALLGLEARVRAAESKIDDAADFLEDLEPRAGGWIAPDDLEGLKAILGRTVRDADAPVLYDGARVRIVDGPGKGKTGTVVEERAGGRLEVETDPKSEGRQTGRVAVFSRNVRRLESAGGA